MRNVVVPLDGSSFAESAVRVARVVAARRDEGILLVRVTVPATSAADDDYLAQVAATIVEVPVETALVVGQEGEHTADALARVLADRPDDLVCMAAHGRGVLGSAIIGSTTEELIHRVDRPVLVVGRHCSETWPDQARLLVPLDCSERAERIVTQVAAIVEEWDLEPWLLQVAHPFDTEAATNMEHSLDRARARFEELGVSPKLDFQFSSNAAVAIDGQAKNLGASLIVMSSFVHPGVARALLGSVTMHVIHGAPCPVLVCPPDVPASEPERRRA
jgi:nucleotide-binding universal stress UspA family protein